MSRTYEIPKQRFVEAWNLVKKNKGAAGVDGESLQDFERNLENNLYKLWNRMSSGSYMASPVKAVDIPKAGGGTRRLGIPTVMDRVAQAVVKLTLEPVVEPHFHEDSYGYRPGKSAHDAVAVTRMRCWKYDWVLELDIKGMFDNIPQELILKALSHHTQEKWIHLYCERWLKADMLTPEGVLETRTKGTPQGGVVSPLLVNLFMHYGFDLWMQREFPLLPWARYADDIVIHARTEDEAVALKERLQSRLREIGLEMHPEKTQIVYCKDSKRKNKGRKVSFTFLGFEFRPREALSRSGGCFTSFSPAVGKAQLKEMRRRIKYDFKLNSKLHWSLEDIAKFINPVVRGWLQYFGAFRKSELVKLAVHLNWVLARWLCRKHQINLAGRETGYQLLKTITRRKPDLFVHWKISRS